jgi:hypothetical protein
MNKFTKFSIILFILTIVFTFCLSFSVCHAKSWIDNWTLNGVPLKKFAHTTPKEKLQLVGGMATSLAVHCASHLLYLEMMDADWHMETENGWLLSEICDSDMSHKQTKEFALAGFVGQLTVGTFLNLGTKKGNMFVTGYNIWSFIEVSTYPLIHNDDEVGDLVLYENNGGDPNKAYGLLTAWSIALMVDYK